MKPDLIKKWLKDAGKDRFWLAEQCGVSKSTVDGWMSNKPIPRQAETQIASLMFSETTLNPKFTLDQFSKIQQRAKSAGMSVEDWIAKVIIGALAIAISLHPLRPLNSRASDFLAVTTTSEVALLTD